MDSTSDGQSNFRSPERWNSVPVPERVSERVLNNIDIRPDGCWISRYSTASHGYSQIGWQNAGKRHVVLGHRAAWAGVNGQVPLGMTLDHTCKTRRCVNPAHLRMLPNYENARRVDGEDWAIGFCKRGHPNSELREYPRDGRMSKECGVTYNPYPQPPKDTCNRCGQPATRLSSFGEDYYRHEDGTVHERVY